MITIVDYGVGNHGSIKNMLSKIGAASEVTSDPERIRKADKLILPGVGAFDAGMQKLESTNLIPVLSEQVLQSRVPVLGICLGMQLMTRRSEEGAHSGLGWISASTVRFRATDPKLRIPHMGWNTVQPVKPSPLLLTPPEELRFYFVHSYFVKCEERQDVLMTAQHGMEFDAAIMRGNIFGVQFHPEKSHRFGMWLLKNFVEHC